MTTNEAATAYGRFLRDVWQRPFPSNEAEQARLWFLFWQWVQVQTCPPP